MTLKKQEGILKNKKIAVIGLGYVGLPLAIKLSKIFNVVGYDISYSRINQLKKNKTDKTNEVKRREILNSKFILFTNNFYDIVNCDVFIITLPTPVNIKKNPATKNIINFCQKLSTKINKKFTIILESTVYPGFCENKIKPIFEKKKLEYNKDFFIGYSPERINPGKTSFKLNNIIKIISGSNKKTLNLLSYIYSKITKAGLYKVKDIKIAEAAKVIENTQRDVNVALINEFTKIFKKMNLDIYDILKAAGTKWNFLKFKPGMVGGHCISVDPYYLIYQSKKYNFNPKLIINSRDINDKMPSYIANNIAKTIKKKNPKGLVMGLTFKENCPDTRNSGSINLIKILKKKKHDIFVYDPNVNIFDLKFLIKKLNVKIINNNLKYDYIVFAVAHDEFKKIKISNIYKLLRVKENVFDLKNIFKGKYNFFSI